MIKIGSLVQVNRTCRDSSYVGKTGIVLEDYVSWEEPLDPRFRYMRKVLLEEQILYLFAGELSEFGPENKGILSL